MSRRASRLQSRKKVGGLVRPVHVSRPVERIPRESLIDRRQKCIEEIARLRLSTNTSGNLLDKAGRLLTKYWADSTWGRRADILRSAEWLLGICLQHGDYSHHVGQKDGRR
jgi:hypothetical protein